MTAPAQPVAPVPDAQLLLDGTAIDRILRRIANEIIERHNGALERLVLVGIPSRGVEISKRLVEQIRKAEGRTVESGVIDVSMHRDDLQLRPRLSPLVASHLPPDLDERTLVLVDDVLFSGRTCRAAMDAISSFGRPARIEYAVLIDRGHRELPIRADYVGKEVTTGTGQRVFVRFEAVDQVGDAVWVSQSR